MIDSERYQIKYEIGRGAMGVVYCALDTLMDREVALKVLSLAPGLNERDIDELVARFMREAQAAGRLSGHHNIVTTHDVGEQDGMYFIAMELIEGEPLTDLMERGVLPFTNIIDIMLQLCDAMDYAHSRGVIHRDLKPENIFILPDGSTKVTDFGIARVLSKGTVTEVGTIIGTPGYMSPEQVKGQEVRPASDIFAAGAILYELLVGVNPFEYGIVEPSYTTVIYRVVNEDPVPMAEIDPEMPPELDTIVGRALQKDPADRYPSFRHFLNDLTLVSRMFPEFAYHISRHLISGELLAAAPIRTPVKAPRLTLRKKPLEVPEGEEAPAPVDYKVETGAPYTEEAPVSAPTEEEVPSAPLPEEEPPGAPPEEPVVEDLEEEVPQGATLVVKREEVPIEEEPPLPAEPEEVVEEPEPEAEEAEEQREPEPAVAAYEEEVRESPRRGNLVKVLVASVILLVAIGGLLALLMWPTPEPGTTVPDVVGKAEDEAKWAIEKAGFEFSSEYKTDNSAEAGKVLDQSPKAGKEADENSKVAVIVASRGKVDVPNICGMTQDEALGLLGQNQLNYKITQEGNPDQSLHSLVLGQTPAAGSTLDAGSEVELIVAVFQGEQPQQDQQTETQRVRKTRQVTCSRCHGSGVISENYTAQETVTCPTCGGTGMTPTGPCPNCGGTGTITQTVTKTRQVTCTTCGGTGYVIEEYWVYE